MNLHITVKNKVHRFLQPFILVILPAESKARAGFSAGGQDPQAGTCGLAEPPFQRLRRHHGHH